jgi:hypothetical protein
MFLAPLIRNREAAWMLTNADTADTLTARVEAAFDSHSRNRGLLGRTALVDTALVLAPCNAIHTFFMKFPIDVIFVDRQGRVVRLIASLPPWRIAIAPGAFATIELSAHGAVRAGLRVGHRLQLTAA